MECIRAAGAIKVALPKVLVFGCFVFGPALSCAQGFGAFSGLGFLPGATSSSGVAISGDGSIIVGESGGQAVRWLDDGAIVPLGFLPGYSQSVATGISRDGTTIVGRSSRPFKWTSSGGMQPLTGVGTASNSFVVVNADGSVIAGDSGTGYRWTEATGPVSLGLMPGTSFSEPLSISDDGNVIVGYGAPSSGGTRAFRWTADGGISELLVPSSSISSTAMAISGNGQTVIGMAFFGVASGFQSIRWNAQGVASVLPPLPGHQGSWALDITADGETVVGNSVDVSGSGTGVVFSDPFIWDGDHGTRSVMDLVAANGGNTTGWSFNTPFIYSIVVSADGSTLAGAGINPLGQTEAWVARLAPQPAIAVTSIDGRQLLQFDTAGNATVLADAADGLFSPLGVVQNSAGNLLVADVLASKIQQVTTSGSVSTFAGLAQGVVSPTGLAMDGAGNVIVADYLAAKVTSYDASAVGTQLAGAAQGISRPFDVAIDSLGNTFVADVDAQKVFKINAAGSVSVFADAADGLFSPLAVTVGPDDKLYVADVLTSKIHRFDALGNGSVFADAADGLVTPTGIIFDANGFLFAANYLGDNIIKLDSAGNGSVFAAATRPWDVTGLASAPMFSGTGLTWAVPVPEPSSGTLAIVGLLAVLLCRATKRVIGEKRGQTEETRKKRGQVCSVEIPRC